MTKTIMAIKVRQHIENIETIEMSEELPITEINAELGGFDFLEEEPDLYSIEDLKKKYV